MFRFVRKPVKKQIDSKWMKFSASFEETESLAVVEYEVVSKAAEVSAADVQAFNEFVKVALDASLGEVRVIGEIEPKADRDKAKNNLTPQERLRQIIRDRTGSR